LTVLLTDLMTIIFVKSDSSDRSYSIVNKYLENKKNANYQYKKIKFN